MPRLAKKKKKPSMNGQITSAAHSTLQYVISRAMLEGKTGRTVLEIPMTDLYNEFEGPRFQPESASLVLRIIINTEWAEGDPEGLLETDLIDDEDAEEGF